MKQEEAQVKVSNEDEQNDESMFRKVTKIG